MAFANLVILVKECLSIFLLLCNKFVQFLAKEVTTKIANEVKKAKYYSINVDFTSDVIHVDQLTFIIRYVQDYGTLVKRFLKFIDSNGQNNAESITNHILRTFSEYETNLDNCRGLSYDNASSLFRKYARLKALNRLIHYISCSAH